MQAAPSLAETLYLLDLAEANPAVLGVVGWVDLVAADAGFQIEKLGKHSKLKGLRPMLHDLPDPAWIVQPVVQPALATMENLGLVFDALIRPFHLPHILTMPRSTRTYPLLSIIAANLKLLATRMPPGSLG